ncbi:MAG: metallophosphoesterase [Xanthomonadales bacterium]|nr:metallophosphoesterase [Xanthomonadales bacterium]
MSEQWPLKIAQITDCHLGPEPDYELNGQPVESHLLRVLEAVRDWRPHLLVATGDLTDFGDEAAYLRLNQHLNMVDVPVRVIPGNHDDGDVLARHLTGGRVALTFDWHRPPWTLLFLDSLIPGFPDGRVSQQELDRLAELGPAQLALVFVHHPPQPVGSDWIDAMGMRNGDDLLRVAEGLPGIQAIACGHVHHVYEDTSRHPAVLTTPSTSYQTLPVTPDFEVDTQPPGFRAFELYPDGQWTTHVTRVP